MTTKKYETISIRLEKSDSDLIRSYAEHERVSVSALIRSTMIRLINQESQKTPNNQQSPSPALDKLSFDTRYQLFKPLDFLVGSLMLSGFSVPQVEQILLHDARLGLTRENLEFHTNEYQKLES